MRRPRSCLHPYGHRTRVEDCVGIIDINALNIPRGLSDDARASVDVSREVDGETVETVIFLIPTYPHFGGVRWWLSCPSCGGRSGKLYLPTPHGEFACRLCHDLTYESCLRSKDSDAFLRKVAAEAGLSLRLVKELLG